MIFDGNDIWKLKSLEATRNVWGGWELHATYIVHKEDGDYEFDIPRLKLPIASEPLIAIHGSDPFDIHGFADLGFGELAFPNYNGAAFFTEKKIGGEDEE